MIVMARKLKEIEIADSRRWGLPLCEISVRRLWSLPDMIRWAITNYAGMYGVLDSNIAAFAHVSNLPRAIATADIDQPTRERIASCADFVLQEAKILNLDHTIQMAQQLGSQLRENRRFSAELLTHELFKLKQLIVMESSKKSLAFISPPYDIFFEQERLFGDLVYEVFPEARSDLKDAGNCLAASLPTAGVFHLMRVAEYGLRELARRLHVKLTHTGKAVPIEFADWNQVLTEIKNKIAVARKTPGGPKRQAKYELYSNAADHCEYMKDIWRNNIAHARKAYSGPEAVGVLQRVRDFMQFLSNTFKQKTPLREK
jgi:hypothetical protein